MWLVFLSHRKARPVKRSASGNDAQLRALLFQVFKKEQDVKSGIVLLVKRIERRKEPDYVSGNQIEKMYNLSGII